jgi:hypothetical protein
MVEEEVAARAITTMRMMIVPTTVLENYLTSFPTQIEFLNMYAYK